jgi:hypothetical protein
MADETKSVLTSKAALKKMVEKVSPYFEEIGVYLASFGEVPTGGGMCLGYVV